ncbi:hypothetical protein B398_03240 [Xylella fastidiosa 32]|nr:hypothetical protein B398_03240 [Xylella fastidiosa 32]
MNGVFLFWVVSSMSKRLNRFFSVEHYWWRINFFSQVHDFLMHKILRRYRGLLSMQLNRMIDVCVVTNFWIVNFCKNLGNIDSQSRRINALLHYMLGALWMLCLSYIEWMLPMSCLVQVLWHRDKVMI